MKYYTFVLVFISLALISGCVQDKGVIVLVHYDKAANQWEFFLENASKDYIFINTDYLFEQAFQWELYENGHLLRTSVKPPPVKSPIEMSMPTNPPAPRDIAPGKKIKINLVEKFPELTSRLIFDKADSFVWHFRTWDMKSERWIQKCGTLNVAK